jgi:regulator of sirC expression with transglutaminase-like and TPR domain
MLLPRRHAVRSSFIAISYLASPWAFRPARAQRLDRDLQTLRFFLTRPEPELDLARAKLTIDRMVDPAVDVDATLRQLDTMAANVRRSAGLLANSLRTLGVLRSYLYDAGSWNDQRPFQFDLDDPLGHRLANKLLHNHLRTKKGNCVSMPALYVLLGQKLGLDITFALAPSHVLAKFRDETGRWINVEAVSGGHPKRPMRAISAICR